MVNLSKARAQWKGPLLSLLACTLALPHFAQPVLAQPAAVPLRINSGGWPTTAVDPLGVTWLSDRYYTAGRITYRSTATNGAFDPVLSTGRDNLYLPELVYRIPLVNGSYQVKLHFIEFTSAPGARRFDVIQNSVAVLQNFDILSEVPLSTRLIKTLPPATVTNGILELVFRPVAGLAGVSGIEVLVPEGPNLNVSLTSMAFSAIAGGANPASQTFDVVNSGSGGSLSWSATTGVSWLAVSPPGGSTPTTGVSVTAATGSLAAGSYSASIAVAGGGQTRTIPVTFTVSAPPNLAVAPASLAFVAAAGGPNPATQSITVSNTGGGGPLAWTATDDASWLTVTPVAGNTPTAGIAVTAATGSLAPATYTATITVTGGGQTRTIPVTFTVNDAPILSVAPATLTFAATAGGASPASQTFNVTNTGTGGPIAWTASSNAPWLAVTPGSGTTPAGAVTVTAATGSLAAGAYSASISVAGAGQTRTIPVTFNVAAPPTLAVAPASLSFLGTAGGPDPTAQSVSLSNSGAGGAITWTAVSNAPWLSVAPASGSTPSAGVAVSVSAAGLSAGTYGGEITFNSVSPGGLTRVLPVSFSVSSAGQTAVIRINSGSWGSSFTDPQGRTWLTDRYYSAGAGTTYGPTFENGALDAMLTTGRDSAYVPEFNYRIPLPNGAYLVNLHFVEYTNGPGGRRFSVLQNGVTVLDTFDIRAEVAIKTRLVKSLPAAMVTNGILELTFRAGPNPATISGIEVFAAAPSPNLNVAPSSMSFTGTVGGTDPATQTFAVTNTGGGGPISWTASDDATWLTVTPTTGTTPSNSVTVAVATGSLTAGLHTATITISGGGQSRTIPVTFTIGAPNLSVVPITLSFAANTGGPNPATQSFSVTNVGEGGAIAWTATDDAAWLTIMPASGNTPGAGIAVSAVTGALAPATYNASITVTGAGQVRTIPVTFTVDDAPNLTALPLSLSFAATSGGTNPATQTLTVTNAGGGGPVAWTATSGAPWLTVSPPSGNTPSTGIVVEAATGSLAAGTYTAGITVTGAAQTRTIPVTFTISAPPTLTVAPGSLSFLATTGGSDPSAQAIAVSNTGSGGAIAWTAVSSAPWLSIEPAAGSTPSPGLAVAVHPAGLSAGTYTGELTFTSTGPGGTRVVPVSLTVSNAGQTAVIRINAGGWETPFTDTQGRTWLTDRYYSAGTGNSYGPSFENGVQDAMLTTGRDSVYVPAITYQIPVPNGSYQVNLHFVEYYNEPGIRRFSVQQNGVTVLQDLDIRAEVPRFTRLVKSLPVTTVTNGILELRFQAGTGSATVSGIEVLTASSGSLPDLAVGPGFLAFSAFAGGANPQAQNILVTNIGGGGPIAWTAADDAAWLSVSPASGSTPSTGVTAQVNVTGLGVGTYSATVSVSGAGQTRSVPVTLTVLPPNDLSTTPSSLVFTAVTNGPLPSPRLISIANLGVGPISWTAVSNQPWLTVSQPSGSTPFNLVLSVDQAGSSRLTAGPGTRTRA
ncbi:MAG: malectin domain-containing carbohydrate-binding protein [Bryobacteraceae bacterium]